MVLSLIYTLELYFNGSSNRTKEDIENEINTAYSKDQIDYRSYENLLELLG